MNIKPIIKRDGRTKPFDRDRIEAAVLAAFNEVDGEISEYAKEKAKHIADYVEEKATEKQLGVEEIQDYVECGLSSTKRKDVAKAYILYREERNRARGNLTDATVLEVIDGTNEYWNTENSNKNPKIASTQRDYMAGVVSSDITRRMLLPKDIMEAHDSGVIHFHDADYFIQHIFNCFDKETKFITTEGLKSFKDYNDGDEISVLSLDGKWHKATVHNYGIQKLYRYTFYNGKKEFSHDVVATENHRWVLKNGKETTRLKVGDKLAKPPVIYNQMLDFESLSHSCQLAWCKGFAVGDGTIEYGNKDANGKNIKANRTTIRLCGKKQQYLDRFNIDGCKIRNYVYDNGDKSVVIYNYHKEIPNFSSVEELQCFLNGLYCADGNIQKQNGNGKINFRLQSSDIKVIDFIRQYADTCGLYITRERDITGETTNYGTRPYTISFSFNPDFSYSYTVLNKQYEKEDEVWCLEVEDTHNFILEFGIPTGNCCLVNMEDILQNGTVINGTAIEKPHSFATACNIATQVMAVVASGQYGGQSVSLAHLAPFIDVSRQKIKEELIEEKTPEDRIEEITELRLRREVKKGVQTMQYQINTLSTTNGQSPFVTLFMYLNETKDEQTKADLAMLIEEVLNQRYEGVKNEKGVYVSPTFPKLVYVLQEDNIRPGAPYWYLTQLAAKCSAKRLVPDYVSEKVMKRCKVDENGNGHCYPPMGKRKL